ncbi:MAG: ubiquinol-cytochrome c reductase iron-sulfur subunit [Microcystaceae cyanobacterium]
MKRRNFCYWISVGILAGNLPVILAACNNETPTTETKKTAPKLDTTPREDGFQALGTIEHLKTKGTIIDRRNAPKPVLIFTHPKTKKITAINPMCTHQGCTVKLNEETFICPCHGSKFFLDGTVINPPANKPLEIFELKQENDLLLVKVPS